MRSLLESLTLKFARRKEEEEEDGDVDLLLLPDYVSEYGLSVARLEKLNYPTDSEINNYGINCKIISMYDSEDAASSDPSSFTPQEVRLQRNIGRRFGLFGHDFPEYSIAR